MPHEEWNPGLDPPLRQLVESRHIVEGALYGTVPEEVLQESDKRALLQAGWTRRPYRDGSVFEPPTAAVEWERLKGEYRDLLFHAVHHKAPADTPWVGSRLEILNAVVESAWEERQEELRVLLNAWAYTSLWQVDPDGQRPLESQEVFFFYTARMRDAAVRALREGLTAPDAEDNFWAMIDALVEG